MKPLGEKQFSMGGLCPNVSAGHMKHEYTTGTSWPAIIQQFEEKGPIYEKI